MKLREMPNTAVHCKTREEYDQLMKVYEDAGWKWKVGQEPTAYDAWKSKDPGSRWVRIKVRDRFSFCQETDNCDCQDRLLRVGEFLREQCIDAKGIQVEEVTRLFHSYTVYKGKDAELWHDAASKNVRIKEGRKSRTVSVADVTDLPSWVDGFFASKA